MRSGGERVASGPLVRSSFRAEEAVERYGMGLKEGIVGGYDG